MTVVRIDQGQSSSSAGNTCLSPITLIELYMPGPANKTQQYPIYRSTREARTVVDSDDDGKHQSHPVNDDEHFNSDIGQKTTNFNVANVQITPDTFMNLCPALLVQIEQGSCSERYNQRSEADPIIQPTEGKENQHIGKQELFLYWKSCFSPLFWPCPLIICWMFKETKVFEISIFAYMKTWLASRLAQGQFGA